MLDALFGSRTYRTLKAALSYEGRRASIIAHNLANVETPGYTRHSPEPFDSYLQKVLKSSSKPNPPVMESYPSVEYYGAPKARRQPAADEPAWTLDVSREAREDGNNVEAAMELADLADAEMRYSVLTQLLGEKYAGIKSILSEGRR